MKITDYVENRINKLPKGYVFTYSDIVQDVNQKEAVIKALNRMVKAGKLAKLAKGKFYRPENSPFGNLEPIPQEVVKDLLTAKGNITGYLTGYSIYNQLGLTTQTSNTIQIGKNEIRPTLKRGPYIISFIKQKNNITKENIKLLQLLDAIKFIKKIPDTTVEKSCKQIVYLLNELQESDINRLISLALKYPPSTRALLGAMLDSVQKKVNTDKLYHSLNPITKYKLPEVKSVLPSADKWNIQ
ncbi:MAG: DUF6088 family protein [Bacteroidales bacterium]